MAEEAGGAGHPHRGRRGGLEAGEAIGARCHTGEASLHPRGKGPGENKRGGQGPVRKSLASPRTETTGDWTGGVTVQLKPRATIGPGAQRGGQNTWPPPVWRIILQDQCSNP